MCVCGWVVCCRVVVSGISCGLPGITFCVWALIVGFGGVRVCVCGGSFGVGRMVMVC